MRVVRSWELSHALLGYFFVTTAGILLACAFLGARGQADAPFTETSSMEMATRSAVYLSEQPVKRLIDGVSVSSATGSRDAHTQNLRAGTPAPTNPRYPQEFDR